MLLLLRFHKTHFLCDSLSGLDDFSFPKKIQLVSNLDYEILDQSVLGQNDLQFLFIYSFTRISLERFDHLLGLVQEKIIRKHHLKQPISAEKRLAITLRHLASGDSQQLIAFLFKVDQSTANGIINKHLMYFGTHCLNI